MPAKSIRIYSSDLAAKLTTLSADLRNLGHALKGFARDRFGDRDNEYQDLEGLSLYAERHAEEVLLVRSMLCQSCQMMDYTEEATISRSSK